MTSDADAAVPIFQPDSDMETGPVIDGAPEEPVLDVDEIQGAVTPGFGTKFQHIMVIRFIAPTTLRRWLTATGPPSTLGEVMTIRNARRSARRAGPLAAIPPTPVMSAIGLTQRGLSALIEVPSSVDPAFRGGMRSRSAQLGDPTDPAHPGHRDHWLFGGTPETVPDAVLILACDDDLALDDAVAEATARLSAGDATLLHEQRGHVLPGEVEHFGFRDGISQVGVRGRLSNNPRHFLTRRWLDPEDERAKDCARPGQPLVWPGRFVYGYPAGTITDALSAGEVRSGGPAWTRNGSLLVLRRLKQDVATFKAFIAAESSRLQGLGRADATSGRLAASLVGRWPDGSALMRAPQAPSAQEATDMLAINHFGYAEPHAAAQVCDDPLVAGEALAAAVSPELRLVAGSPADPVGMVCPRFAHIRKVNPRDEQTDKPGAEQSTRTFQMLRRGITWGAAYVDDEPVGVDRGLLFMSYQTDIKDQFERLNTIWMNRGDVPQDGSGFDLLVGQRRDGDRTGDLPATGDQPAVTVRVPHLMSWVIPTGGDYFYMPSLSVLKQFAAGDTAPRHPADA